MHNIRDLVYANQTVVPEFSVYETESLMVQFDPHLVLGNDLRFQATVDQRYAGYIKPTVYDTERINVHFYNTTSSGTYYEIHFSNQFAVALDRINHLIVFFQCRFESFTAVGCQEVASSSIQGQDLILKRDLNVVQRHWLFCWAVDRSANRTFFYLFDGRNKVEVYNHTGVADDATATTHNGVAYIAISYGTEGYIMGWMFTDDPATGHAVPHLYLNRTGLEFFCPTELDFDPQNHNILEILSVCPGKDQRIIRYRYPPVFDNRTNEWSKAVLSMVPINLAFQNPQICSMGTEFAVFSQLNGRSPDLTSYSTQNDRNRWYFGTQLDELNLGTIRRFNCVPRAGIFTVVGLDHNQNTTFAVYWGNNQFQANHKVYNTLRTNLDQYKWISSYEFMGQVITTLSRQDETHDFLLTLSNGPLLDVNTEYGIGNASVPMSLRFTNGRGREEFVRTLFVQRPYTNITKKVIKKIVYPFGKYNLEKYVDFEGPVVTGQMSNTSYGAILHGRVQEFDAYIPSRDVQFTMDEMESYGNKTVSSHTSYNSTTGQINSLLYIFHNYSKFVGTATPAHGVRTFHFAPFNSTDNNTILVAYASAEINGSTLEFIALNKSTRIGVGRASLDPNTNFTKIRVTPINGMNKFIVFGLNRDDNELHSYNVTFDNGRIISDLIEVVQNVYDFTLVDLDYINYVVAYWVPLYNRTALNATVYSRSYVSKGVSTPFSLNGIGSLVANSNDAGLPFNIDSIESAHVNQTHFYVLLNTQSVNYFEIVVDLRNRDPARFYAYFKVPGTIGYTVRGNYKYFVAIVADVHHRGHFSYNVYERQQTGGNAHLYWSVPAENRPRPFTVSTDFFERRSHFNFATSSPSSPISFNEITPMEIEVMRYANLSSLVIEVDGISPQPRIYTNFSEIYTAQSPAPQEPQKAKVSILLASVTAVLMAAGLVVVATRLFK